MIFTQSVADIYDQLVAGVPADNIPELAKYKIETRNKHIQEIYEWMDEPIIIFLRSLGMTNARLVRCYNGLKRMSALTTEEIVSTYSYPYFISSYRIHHLSPELRKIIYEAAAKEVYKENAEQILNDELEFKELFSVFKYKRMNFDYTIFFDNTHIRTLDELMSYSEKKLIETFGPVLNVIHLRTFYKYAISSGNVVQIKHEVEDEEASMDRILINAVYEIRGYDRITAGWYTVTDIVVMAEDHDDLVIVRQERDKDIRYAIRRDDFLKYRVLE